MHYRFLVRGFFLKLSGPRSSVRRGAPVSRRRSISLPEMRVLASASPVPGGRSAGSSTSE